MSFVWTSDDWRPCASPGCDRPIKPGDRIGYEFADSEVVHADHMEDES